MSSRPQYAKTWTPPEPLHLWPSPESRRDEAFAHDWEPDISPTARHNILFFWAAPTWNSRSLARLPLVSSVSSCLPAVRSKVSQGRGNSASGRLLLLALEFFLRIVLLTEDKDMSRADWLREIWTRHPFQMPFLHFALCMQLYDSISILVPASQLAEWAELGKQTFCPSPLVGIWPYFTGPVYIFIEGSEDVRC